MKKVFMSIFAGLIVGLIPNSSSATPVEWAISSGGNGHWYEIIKDTSGPMITWQESNAVANTLSYNGLSGHLATVTSYEEIMFLSTPIFLGASYSLYGDLIFLGGYQTPTGQPEDTIGNSPSDNWAWVTGEVWSYTNWAWGDPNNGRQLPGQNEDYLVMSGGWFNTGLWSDSADQSAPTGTGGVSYIIEYEADQNDPVPEPATLFLMGAGLMGIIGIKRKKK